MKKFDLVKLVNFNEYYLKFNLYSDVEGFVLDINLDKLKVLFLNKYLQGDYAFLEVDKKDVVKINSFDGENCNHIQEYIDSFKPMNKGFDKINFKIYQKVELLVEDDKYSKFNVHKGDIGIIMEDYATKNYLLVDFGKINDNGEYIGDCISVNIKDLKFI